MDASVLPVSEATVAELVTRFYDRVRADPRLGPVFEAAIADWDQHLRVMRDFWSAVLLRTDRYRGCVMSAHVRTPLEAGDIGLWLAHFRPAARATLPPEPAERAILIAEAVGERLGHAFARRAWAADLSAGDAARDPRHQ